MILPGKHHLDHRYENDEHLTIFLENPADDVKGASILCENFRLRKNRSVIVTDKLEVLESDYDNSDIWSDCYGTSFHHCKR